MTRKGIIWKKILGWHVGDLVRFETENWTMYGVVVETSSKKLLTVLVLRLNGFIYKQPVHMYVKEKDLKDWQPRKPKAEIQKAEQALGRVF